MTLRSLAWFSRLCHSGTSLPRAGEISSSSSARAGSALGCSPTEALSPAEPAWGEASASKVRSRSAWELVWESTGSARIGAPASGCAGHRMQSRETLVRRRCAPRADPAGRKAGLARRSETSVSVSACGAIQPCPRRPGHGPVSLELELIQPHMAQKPRLRGEVGARVRVICTCGQRRERRHGSLSPPATRLARTAAAVS